ncbi:c-type cytochrome [Methylacidiphilum caldifontis]|uniref:Cytochrome C n=1 Tax=Methylacidiphilum caldifontis TaxID=2795386 RepID=A0A4Y8P8V3_9BACT|nr:cytochrome c [Methylacidiphilum caldifontis]TFE67070.1 cytochrome C [Methylacidiphilum caldifontis]
MTFPFLLRAQIILMIFLFVTLKGYVFAEKGESLYLSHCASCHGQNGEGLGSNPPLKNSSWVRGDPQKLIQIVLNGYAGRMIVNNEEYRGRMPAWRTELNDSQIASVLTYLRSLSGAEPISPSQVSLVREKSKNKPIAGGGMGGMGCGGGHMGHGHRHGHSMGMGMGCGGCGH